MQFADPLTRGTLIQRYKRFLSDIEMADGETVIAHCANPGSMMGLADPGSEVWLSPNRNPKAKLDWRWELVRIGAHLVGINTSHPNAIVAEAIEAGHIAELTGYGALKREVRYGQNSRIDILLDDEDRPPCYVEIKNVNLKRGLPGRENAAEFPDAVTKRGAKHLVELGDMVESGARAVMLYLVQREDCDSFCIAEDIDPDYAEALELAITRGVETLCYACDVRLDGIDVAETLPIERL
ncbi:MAG: DNA/RNA nuclease SfsA [Alphaproteobacteria bacterium]|nr:DNA/RNA nuclease SfsA [Alphaproteobacteria bacterium]